MQYEQNYIMNEQKDTMNEQNDTMNEQTYTKNEQKDTIHCNVTAFKICNVLYVLYGLVTLVLLLYHRLHSYKRFTPVSIPQRSSPSCGWPEMG